MMNGPTRGLSSPRLPHKGLGYTIGCGGPGATGGRGEAILKDTPHAQPLHSQEGGPGLGAQSLGFRPSLDFNLLSEEGDPPNLCGPQFPPQCYPWHPSCPAVPLLLHAHSVTPTAPPYLRLNFPVFCSPSVGLRPSQTSPPLRHRLPAPRALQFPSGYGLLARKILKAALSAAESNSPAPCHLQTVWPGGVGLSGPHLREASQGYHQER